MIEKMADIYFSSLSEVLPMLRDALGAALLVLTFLFPIIFISYFVFRFIKYLIKLFSKRYKVGDSDV